eukprot:TRINITY_DN6818_c0_g1_i2.p2 TRINITY_DN6818_c0_g1~~TRINITY_DN6818_c0_g1_i2.p2  ORF type:complete len:129 (+),score=3.63 TRINITY_DN6818_c0_g1_i2:93-479(+)
MEIYNDSAYDLLQEKAPFSNALQINEVKPGEFAVKGVCEQAVKCTEDILQAIKKGESNRHYAESVMNHNSSRSHTIFRLKLARKSPSSTQRSEIVVFFYVSHRILLIWPEVRGAIAVPLKKKRPGAGS